MSVALFIVLDNKKPGFDTFVNGKALAKRDDVDEVARKLGVRPLNDFVWVAGDAIDDSKSRARPKSEIVVKHAVRREPGFLNFLAGNDIWRRTRTQPGEKIATVDFLRDSNGDWLYSVDQDGNIVRIPKHAPSKLGEPFFAADEGLATVRALRAHYANISDAMPVLSELDEYENVLAQAAARGFRFHLGVDI